MFLDLDLFFLVLDLDLVFWRGEGGADVEAVDSVGVSLGGRVEEEEEDLEE